MEKWVKKGEALLAEIRETKVNADELAFWFIGQCGFIFKSGEKIILIDPVLNDITGSDGLTRKHYGIPFTPQELQPDYVFCTHGHIDHMAGPTVGAIAAAFPETKFVIPAGCRETAKECGIPEGAMVCLSDGKEWAFDGISVRAFSEAHPTHVYAESDPMMALGYCISLNGIRVVHLGDTYLTETLLRSLEGLDAPHIFLPPINGDDRFRALRDCIGNMEAEESAKLAVHLGADLSVPTHYDMIFDNNVDPLRFAAELRRISPTAKWKIPALGERVIYRR